MADTWWDYLVRAWIEYWGKRRPPLLVTFQENEIVARGESIRVRDLFGAVFLNVDPNVFVVLTAPDGTLTLVPGGYNRLEPGFYLRHYVDKRTRTNILPSVTDTTLDGAKVTLTLALSYNVIDPIKAMKLEHPVETLLALVQIDIGEFIKEHTHDEILGRANINETGRGGITQYLYQQHQKHYNVAPVFSIVGIAFQRRGDPKLMDIRLEDRHSTARLELDHKIQGLEQQIAEKEAEVNKIKAQAITDIQKIEAQTNTEIQKLRAETEATIEAQRNEIERQREAWLHQQNLDMSISHILEKMLTIPGYHPSNQELTLLYNRFSQNATDSPPADDTKSKKSDEPPNPYDSLSKTLLVLLNRRKPGQ